MKYKFLEEKLLTKMKQLKRENLCRSTRSIGIELKNLPTKKSSGLHSFT
jgi:hypothetical protein